MRKRVACQLVPVSPLTALHFPDDYIAKLVKTLDLHSQDLGFHLTAGGPTRCFADMEMKQCAHSED